MGVRAWAILLVLAVVFPLFVFGWITLDRMARDHADAFTRTQADTARILANAVDSELHAWKAILMALAQSQALQRGRLADFYEEARAVATQHDGWINLVDPSGHQHLNTQRPFGVPLPDTAASVLLQAILTRDQPVVGDIFLGAVAQRWIISVAAPVVRDGKVVYMLAIGFPPDRLTALLKHQNLPAAWTLVIFDSQQRVVTRLPLTEERMGKLTQTWVATALRSGDHGTATGTDIRGVPHRIAFNHLTEAPWSVSVSVPLAALPSPRPVYWFIALGVLLGCGAVAAAVIASRKLSGAVTALATRAAGILRGESPEGRLRSDVREIQDLEDALVQAGTSVQALHREQARAAAAEERAKAEAEAADALRASEERFRVAQELSPDGFTIFRPVRDAAGRVVDFTWLYENAAIARLNGTDPATVVGRRLLELFPGHVGSPFLAAYQQVAETGEPRILEAAYEGDTIPTRTWFRVAVVSMGSDIAVLAQDITARKQAEARLAADLAALTRMHALSARPADAGHMPALLQDIMDAAVGIMGAERGTLQLLEGESLQIVAHHGHDRPFLDYFAAAENVASVCGEATRRGERIVVPDVETSPLFAGTPSLPVLRAAGVRAVQSTPLMTRAGQLLGILTTQWGRPHTPDEHDLWRLDLLARQAADLIEAARADATLRRQQAELQEAQRVGHVGSWHWDAATDVTTGTDEFYRIYGLDPTAGPFPNFRDQDGTLYPRAAWQRLNAAVQDSVRTGVGYDLDVKALRNGAPIWINTRSEVLQDTAGHLVGLRGTVMDITARKQAEEAVREGQERLRLLGDNLPDSAVYQYVHEPDGRVRFLYVSAGIERLNGVRVEDVLRDAGPLHRQIPPEYFARLVEAERRSTRELTDFDMEVPMRRTDGELRWMRLHSRPRRLPDGRVIWDGVQIDVTEHKRAEEALQRAKDELETRVQERTTELSRAVVTLGQQAAQLRALAAELTLAEQRERRRLAHVLHDEHQQVLVAAKLRMTILRRLEDARVQEACREVTGLLEEALEHSRALTRELSPPILHVGGLVPALTWLAGWMREKHRLTIELHTDPTAVPASEAMMILLFQAVRELLFNVVKHAQVPTAQVTVSRQDGQVQVVVSDVGVGFAPSELRVEGGSDRGFGLFSIQQRLALLGGRMEIASAPGRGSRFTLWAPLQSEPETQPAPVAALPQVSPPFPSPSVPRKLRVLLVDDHAIVRQGFARLLGAEPDLEVVGEAADGKVAVELARELRPDVITMDVNMPVLDGVEATRQIRAQCPGVRVIGLSMFDNTERAQAMREAGAAAYLTKSGPAEALLAAIRGEP